MTQVPSAHARFAARAAELQIPCWSVDLQSEVAALSVTPAEAKPHAEIIAAASAAMATGRPFRSPELLALPDAHGAIVADVSACGTTAIDRNRLAAVLKHYHADLIRADVDARSIDGFNEQLSQSYEEVNLIFRMAKLLTSSSEPRQVVQTMCDELRDTLNYGWLAMTFADGDAVLTPMRGVTLHAGPMPWTAVDLSGEIAAGRFDSCDGVVTPANHPLAARAGSELLVERVMQGDASIGLLIAGNRQAAESDVTSNELQLVRAAAGFLGLFHENALRFAAQRAQFLGTLHALSAAVDAKDPYTHGHSERVGLLAAQLAARLDFEPSKIEAVRVAGLLHDIGKIGVPEAVLRKPARLTDEEFALIKQHPEIGYGILRDLPSLAFHLPGVLHHHERYDGRGYPHQLQGEQIPLIARILALADTFDAMSSNRAYRNGMERSRVLEEIRKSSGVQFDPALVEPFVTMDFGPFDAMLAADRAAAPTTEVKAAA